MGGNTDNAPGQSLKQRTARTLKWNTIDRVSQQVALAVIGVVLASTLAIIPTGFASSGEMIWSAVCAVLGAVLAALGGKIRPQEETSES